MTLASNALSQELNTWLQENGYSRENLNQPGENSDSALMKITRDGNLAWIKELLRAGVDVNLKNNDGNNALWFACFGNFYEAIDLLIAANIDIDNQNGNGATALMYAASSGKLEVLQQLLKYGANTELQNLDDFKAIDFSSTQAVWRVLKNAAQ
ncbi:MAG: ankyrin repeat domain-containing protein [Cyanobacteria bacterium P01_A01_bin.123]